ncbi:MAG: hypothetical protein AAF226_03730, partial [Verrucomicrobiota bacterium]
GLLYARGGSEATTQGASSDQTVDFGNDDWQKRVHSGTRPVVASTKWVNKDGKSVTAPALGFTGLDVILKVNQTLAPTPIGNLTLLQQKQLLEARRLHNFVPSISDNGWHYWRPNDKKSTKVIIEYLSHKEKPIPWLSLRGFSGSRLEGKKPESIRLTVEGKPPYSFNLKEATIWSGESGSWHGIQAHLKGKDLEWVEKNLPSAESVYYRFDADHKSESAEIDARELALIKEAIACYMVHRAIYDAENPKK